VGQVAAVGERAGVLGAKDPFADRQQRGVLVPGPGRIPGIPGPAGQVAAGGERVGVLGAQDPLEDRHQRGELVPGPGRIPASPVQRARLPRAVSVPGCSAPETRSRTNPLFYPGREDRSADWLMVGQVPGDILLVPLAPGRTVNRARPIGVYPCRGQLDRQYREDSGWQHG
jgi:hypothetical protein